MEVLLLQDVLNVGLAGQIKKVNEGYARNFLFPRKLARAANSHDLKNAKTLQVKTTIEKEIAGSRVAMLAEHIKNAHLTIKKKVHDDSKLYGAISPDEIVDLLSNKSIIVNRKQVEFPKAIKTTGEHEVVIRLTAKLKPVLKLKVVGSAE
jgi:large subunit ribosomal protein L9